MSTTGDLARHLPDGAIEYLGRADCQIKLNGFRIELGEIEVTLTGHESVDQAVAVAWETATGEAKLCAYVQTAAGADLDVDALRDYSEAKLPYYMVPSAFVGVEVWPVLPNGKLDRNSLPVPDVIRHSPTTYVAPRNRVESKLVQIWQKVLPADRIGVHDDFFALGGDSMRSMKAVLAASENGIPLAVRDFYLHPTVAELAANAGECPSSSEDDESSAGVVPLTSAMRRYLYERKTPNAHHWNFSILLEPTEQLDRGCLEQAVRQLVVRHDSLRLRFGLRNGAWTAYCKDEPHRDSFCRLDYSHLPEGERRAAVERACAEMQTSFDLETGPLFRSAYFDMGHHSADRVFITAHHLLVDGISFGILLEDLESIYQRLRGGSAARKGRVRVSYKQWASRLDRYSQSEEMQKELPFWKGLPWSARAKLPRDYDRGDESNTNESAREVIVALSPEDTAALLDFLPKWTNPDDVLLTALSQALADWGGTTTALVDRISHGRDPIDGETAPSNTIGFLIAYTPLVLTVDPASTPMENVASIAKQLRQIPSSGMGFDLLRYRPDSELADMPPAEVLFNYLGSENVMVSTGPMFRRSSDPHGSINSPQGCRQQALSVVGAKGPNGLEVRFVYSENLHRRETIESLAAKFRERLEAIAKTDLQQ